LGSPSRDLLGFCALAGNAAAAHCQPTARSSALLDFPPPDRLVRLYMLAEHHTVFHPDAALAFRGRRSRSQRVLQPLATTRTPHRGWSLLPSRDVTLVIPHSRAPSHSTRPFAEPCSPCVTSADLQNTPVCTRLPSRLTAGLIARFQ